MNFLIDAHLPKRMVVWLNAVGCNAVHALDLPDENRTTDEQINDVADREENGGWSSLKTPTSWIRTSFEAAQQSSS